MFEQQGSQEWLQARCGRVGASRVADIIAKTKTGWGASRATYMGQLIAERLTGVPMETYTNAAMQWGTEKEPEARATYEFLTDRAVMQCGFILHPDIEMAGASPDSFVGDDGLLECKCPLTSTHIETLLDGRIPGKYEAQMNWQLAVTGRLWVDWVSFDPRMPAHMSIFIKRFYRNDNEIAELEKQVRQFLAELSDKLAALIRAYPGAKEAA